MFSAVMIMNRSIGCTTKSRSFSVPQDHGPVRERVRKALALSEPGRGLVMTNVEGARRSGHLVGIQLSHCWHTASLDLIF